jgi:cyanophycin synthetase
VKPVKGYGGQGVTTHVQSPEELKRAALLASLYGYELMIEEQIPGESYRLLVLEGKMVHAVCRRGPRLRGDGRSSVRQLIEAESAVRRQQQRPELDVDRDCLFTLGYQQLSPESVPPAGREFIVKSVNDPVRKLAEVRTVYSETVTDLVCASVRRDVEQAARIVGSDFLGVDVITTDPTVPLATAHGVINEVNTTPALHHHYDATREPFPAVAIPTLNAILRRKAAVAVRAH